MQIRNWEIFWGMLVYLVLWLIPAKPAMSAPPVVREEQMVVTATMTQKKIQKAPGAIEVISRDDIEALNAQSADEALKEATGLIIASETGRQNRPNIRGTGNKHTLVLIDGRRLSAGYKDFVAIDQIPVDLIDRIEVIRGPSSSLYGSDAIGGVVNIITQTTPEKPEAGVTVQYGQDAYGEGKQPVGRAYFGNSWGAFGFLLAGSHINKERWDRDGTAPDDGDEQKTGNVSGRFSFDLNDRHGLLAGFEHSDMENQGLRFFQNTNRERTARERRKSCFLEYNGKVSPLSTLMFRANHSEHENDMEMSPYAQLTAEEDARRSLDQMEGRFIWAFGDTHVLTAGTEFRSEKMDDSTGRDEKIDNLGFYFQDEYQVLDPLYIVFGLRYDKHSDFGSEWTPRTSLVYSLTDNLSLKASYGTGFRAPSISELFVTSYRKRGKWVYEPNPELRPEASESYEVAVEGQYNQFHGKITAFRNDVEDLIEPVFYKSTGTGNQKTDYYRYENIAAATMEGLELEYGIPLPLGFFLGGHLTYLETEDKQTGGQVEGQPDYKGLLKLEYKDSGPGLGASIRIHYMGERYYSDGTEDDYMLVNARLSKKITGNVELFAGVDNIFNTRRESDNVVSVAPAFFYAGITGIY